MNKYLILILLSFIIEVSAQTNIIVSNIDNLRDKINSASPGDTITVKNGSYDSEGSITITNSGSENLPILIRAQQVGCL